MKINKTILKNIIREALDSEEFDSIVGEQDEQPNASVEKLTSTFIDKVGRIAATELAQIDDVAEVIHALAEIINLLREKNPTDFTAAEYKRVGIELKKMAMDMQNAKPEQPEQKKPFTVDDLKNAANTGINRPGAPGGRE